MKVLRQRVGGKACYVSLLRVEQLAQLGIEKAVGADVGV